MRGALVALSVVAACGGAGVDVEVTSTESFDRVELFIATAECINESGKACDDGVAWLPNQLRPPGTVYYMVDDVNGAGRIVETTTFRGSTAVMHIEASSDFVQPKLIVVVGFRGETPVAVAQLPYYTRLPAHSAETWHVELIKMDTATGNVTSPPTPVQTPQRVHAWKRERVTAPDTLSRCLVMQTWNDTNKIWDSLFIVPESDPDCDGHAIECDARFANLNTNSSPSACVAMMPTAKGTDACTLGSTLCADGVSDDHTCVAPLQGRTCGPQELCNDCSAVPAVESCAAMSVRRNAAVSHLACTLNPTATGAACNPGPSSVATALLPVDCKLVEVRRLGDAFATSTTNIATVEQAQVAVEIDSPTLATCQVAFSWISGTAKTGDSAWFVLIIGSVNANRVAVPVKLDFGATTTDCLTPRIDTQCEASPELHTEPMWDCVRDGG